MFLNLSLFSRLHKKIHDFVLYVWIVKMKQEIVIADRCLVRLLSWSLVSVAIVFDCLCLCVCLLLVIIFIPFGFLVVVVRNCAASIVGLFLLPLLAWSFTVFLCPNSIHIRRIKRICSKEKVKCIWCIVKYNTNKKDNIITNSRWNTS